MSKLIDLTGQRFGRLTVIERAHDYVYPNGKTRVQWLCKCDCGNYCVVLGTNLKKGTSKSCGCLHAELRRACNTTHGGRYTKLYRIWTNMKDRCFNPNNPGYIHYGGRGISVCEEWLDFEGFHAWAIPAGFNEDSGRFECTLERIDVNGNYCPENCTWKNAKEQANNRTNTIFIECNGETHSLSEWADLIGVKYHTLFARLYKLNWPLEKALNTSTRHISNV